MGGAGAGAVVISFCRNRTPRANPFSPVGGFVGERRGWHGVWWGEVEGRQRICRCCINNATLGRNRLPPGSTAFCLNIVCGDSLLNSVVVCMNYGELDGEGVNEADLSIDRR